jgi:hypothetical protein
MISRMRVRCSPRTVAGAEKIMLAAIGTYFAPNLTIPELHEMKSGVGIDPLKEFVGRAEELRRFSSL